MSENIFLNPDIYYMQKKKLQGEEQFDCKSYVLEMPRFHAKMHLKSAQQKLNLPKVVSKNYTPDLSCKCPCTFLHSYT